MRKTVQKFPGGVSTPEGFTQASTAIQQYGSEFE
jgi:hypothetical protein